MDPTTSSAFDPVAAHNSLVVLALVFEGFIGLALWAAFMASLINWVDRRGWRPPNKQKKP